MAKKAGRRSTKKSTKKAEGSTPVKAPRRNSSKRRTGEGTRQPTNLSLDPAVVARVGVIAAGRGTNLSQLVNGLLETVARVSEPAVSTDLPPLVRRLHGVAAGFDADQEAYRAHLREKYQG